MFKSFGHCSAGSSSDENVENIRVRVGLSYQPHLQYLSLHDNLCTKWSPLEGGTPTVKREIKDTLNTEYDSEDIY